MLKEMGSFGQSIRAIEEVIASSLQGAPQEWSRMATDQPSTSRSTFVFTPAAQQFVRKVEAQAKLEELKAQVMEVSNPSRKLTSYPVVHT